MNLPGFLIAAGFGAAFFAAECVWYYQPAFINPDVLLSTFSSEHSKARAAVRHALIDPGTATFGALHSVEAGAARYVCGGVKARDKSGQFVDVAFVYTVAIDFARIDDDGRVTHQRSGYRPCPTADDKVAQQRPVLSPGASSIVKSVQSVVPDVKTSVAPALTKPAASTAGSSSGGTMEQQVRELAARTVPSDGGNGQGANRLAAREVAKESEWRADRPPAAWPTFASDHALARPTRKRTPSEALALAQDVEDRWKKAESAADVSMRPSPADIDEACRALLTIDPKDAQYPNAWAAFARLQRMSRDVARG
ncbi:hypothetical protein LPJ38_17175 [Bradyrhizobium daqingense]|uniref:Uncharacterized protein n=1 Tax=Bradyrhizobium daqingense TaxID=993502 RepID=A0A562LUL5_9BRAD|nr:hypothetical protein [Bradyrhizobium daqingense]TWI11329.1 hypothetical protein IQ17_00479 [Bradyrhizobium daqingense]UFS92372.1 hypothetical protein LPJ38_17175 [Bradyrhizobium daqingense]